MSTGKSGRIRGVWSVEPSSITSTCGLYPSTRPRTCRTCFSSLNTGMATNVRIDGSFSEYSPSVATRMRVTGIHTRCAGAEFRVKGHVSGRLPEHPHADGLGDLAEPL